MRRKYGVVPPAPFTPASTGPAAPPIIRAAMGPSHSPHSLHPVATPHAPGRPCTIA